MTIGVMYNSRYGGFALSDEAVAEYNKRKAEGMPSAAYSARDIQRSNPLMVQIVRELGSRANGMFSDIQIELIEDRYEHHVLIDEYDGSETVIIDYKGYILAEVRKTLQSTSLSSDEKISCMNQLDWSLMNNY